MSNTPSVEEATPLAPEISKDYLKTLREALNTASLEEVRDLIRDELIDYHSHAKIELKKGDETRTLPAEPRHYLFPRIMQAVDAAIPVALVGPAGSGKSTCVTQIATALEKKFYLQNSVQGTHELAGFLDAHGRYMTTTFRKAFEEGGVLLVDEVDTSDAGALKWLNTALANGYAMFPDQPDVVTKHEDFRILIAANTFGTGADRVYVGANQLDASTLDRFCFFNYDYDEQMEILLSGNPLWANRVQEVRSAAAKEKARVVISPRATINGAKLLGIGWPQDEVENALIWKGMDTELRERIEKQVKELDPLKRKLSKKEEKAARRKMWNGGSQQNVGFLAANPTLKPEPEPAVSTSW
jgi:energy-coupling factor transporter ATP-binding protein EcfA2